MALLPLWRAAASMRRKNNTIPHHYRLRHLSVCDVFDGDKELSLSTVSLSIFSTWYQTHGVGHTHLEV